MDPNTAFADMLDTTLDLDARADAASALVGWISNGGAAPRAAVEYAPRIAGVPQTSRYCLTTAANILSRAWDAR